jgi:hypothetical protein
MLLLTAQAALAAPDAPQPTAPPTAVPHIWPLEPASLFDPWANDPLLPGGPNTPAPGPGGTVIGPRAQPGVSPQPAPHVSLEFITDWDRFLRAFRTAVARRDREALKTCMVKNFLFTLSPISDPDRREAAFREWDRVDVHGWEAIERILARGCVIDPMVPSLKVAPPEWTTDPHYIDYRVGFERQGKFWRWVWTMRGD